MLKRKGRKKENKSLQIEKCYDKLQKKEKLAQIIKQIPRKNWLKILKWIQKGKTLTLNSEKKIISDLLSPLDHPHDVPALGVPPPDHPVPLPPAG